MRSAGGSRVSILMVNSPVRALSSPDVSADPLPALFVKKTYISVYQERKQEAGPVGPGQSLHVVYGTAASQLAGQHDRA